MSTLIKTMSPNNMNSPAPIQIRMVDKHTHEKFDIRNLNESAVKSLRTIDPFTYFSIPGIRRASMYLQDIDHSNAEALCNPEVQSARNPSSQANKRPRPSTTITRRTRISYEAHQSAIMEDLMDELDDLSVDIFKDLD